MEFPHCTSDRRRQVDDRFVRLDVRQYLVFLDVVADGDVPFDDLTFGDAFADVGKFELEGHA